MDWNDPPVRWADLERALSGRPADSQSARFTSARSRSHHRDEEHPGDGGDSPAWTRHRDRYEPPPLAPPQAAEIRPRTPYTELHCHSNFSFLDGASHPEELVEEAARLGLDAIAITDHDGMYGVVRFAEAARELGIKTVFGAELSLGLTAPQNGVPNPEGEHLLVLARDPEGYRRLSRVISDAQIAGKEKGRPVYDLDAVAATAGGHWVVLTGCRKAAVRQALEREGPAAAGAQLRRLIDLFGADHVVVELTANGLADDTERNDELAALAAAHGLGIVATTAAHYATPSRHRLATALAAVRARRSLDEMDGWLPAAATAHLRSGAEMTGRFARWPGAVERAAALGRECSFDLHLVAPDLPPFDVPDEHTEASWLGELTWLGAATRYGSYDEHPGAYHQIEHELVIIKEKNFPGYFLIVHDIVAFCRRADIFCQGRGSAANSAVCYALGITSVDAVAMDLLFERFLAPDRDGYPDIDLDIESDRREEVIQYVYARYGRDRAAQVANVITYRPRSAVRDMAKALGYSTGTQDAWSKQIDRWGPRGQATTETDIPEPVLALAAQLEGFPRHLGIHSGGMVICSRPVAEVCPVEWARMEHRSVVQWDKDDCAAAGLVKFDLLGLGMLSALHYAVDLLARHYRHRVQLSDLQPTDSAVYAMLARADSIGVFQVESRAQMATLPRLKPRCFYDLVVEVALIRPGPIQGDSVHPYIRRRNGQEAWDYDHPRLANALRKTLGVPLFQEQLMQMAIDVADFSAAEADELRRAMGAKRSTERMERLRGRLFDGMARHGIIGELAEKIYAKLLAFANFGFPESHSISFASLVYYSAWFKHYYPAVFCAALLRAQPMGFYSPQSLIADARRHGVTVRGPDINASGVHAGLEPAAEGAPEQAVRLGLAVVRTVSQPLATRLVAERHAHGRYRGIADVANRVGLATAQAEALATSGTFDQLTPHRPVTRGAVDQLAQHRPATGGAVNKLVPHRRQALWSAGAVAAQRPDRLPGTAVGVDAPPLPGMSALELAAADVWATGVSPDSFPTQFLRADLAALGVVPAAELTAREDGQRVLVAGAVTHRQRPATAGGVTFLNLEDETGMVNVICSPGFWVRYRAVVRASPALLLRGRLQIAESVITVLAEHAAALDMRVRSNSHDFR